MKQDKLERCYYCDKEIIDDTWVIKPVLLQSRNNNKKMVDRKFHYECLPKFLKKHKSKDNKHQYSTDWEKLYIYFQREILGTTGSSKLQKHYVARLLGLKVGKYMPNNTNTRGTKQGYSFPVILNTFKYCKRQIEWAKKHVKFQSSIHEVDYIMAIVQNNIDMIQKRTDEMEARNKRIEKIKTEESAVRGVAYKRKGTGRRKVGIS